MRRQARESWDVIVAEDNDDHALLIEMALQKASDIPVEIRRARNGDEAVVAIEAEPPDLLLLDLKMPGLSGHEVLEFVKGKEELRGIPVAVLTSSDRDEDVARSYGLGGNHFLTKPENPAELEARLRALLKNLSELSGISRGVGGLRTTGATAVTHGGLQLRSVLTWSTLAVVLGALLLYGWIAGVIP